VGGQHHAPAALPPGKTLYKLYRRLGGTQGRFERVRNISPPTGLDPLVYLSCYDFSFLFVLETDHRIIPLFFTVEKCQIFPLFAQKCVTNNCTFGVLDYCDTLLMADTHLWRFSTSHAVDIDKIRDVDANIHTKCTSRRYRMQIDRSSFMCLNSSGAECVMYITFRLSANVGSVR
jgi:hypothetical protein